MNSRSTDWYMYVFKFDKGNTNKVMLYIPKNLIAPIAISFTYSVEVNIFCGTDQVVLKVQPSEEMSSDQCPNVIKIHWELISPGDISSQNTGVMVLQNGAG